MQLLQLQLENEKLKSEVAGLQEYVKRLQKTAGEMGGLKAALNAKKAELADSADTVAKLERELKQLRAVGAAAAAAGKQGGAADNGALLQQIEILKQEVEEKDEDLESLKEEIERLQAAGGADGAGGGVVSTADVPARATAPAATAKAAGGSADRAALSKEVIPVAVRGQCVSHETVFVGRML